MCSHDGWLGGCAVLPVILELKFFHCLVFFSLEVWVCRKKKKADEGRKEGRKMGGGKV